MQSKFKTEYQTIIQAPIAAVWDGLTNALIVKQYFFGTDLQTTWEVGQPIVFTGSWDGATYVDKGTVLEYVHEKFLSYSYLSSWSGKDDTEDNYLVITYEVAAIDAGTKLTITQTNYDEEKANHSTESWASVIDGLKSILSSH